jgi:tRNA(fMet)-specific endonuclease VapC
MPRWMTIWWGLLTSVDYLLDTNVCMMYINGRSASVRDQILALPLSDVVICLIVKFELSYGAMRTNNPAATLTRQQSFLSCFASLPFDDRAALICGEVRARLTQLGTPIGPYDLQIAAIALAHDLTLVTHNVREFARVEGLRVEDWEVAIG